MPPSVACGQCKVVLNEPPNLPPDKRSPCPHCGSTTRVPHVTGTANIILNSLIVKGEATATVAHVTQANLLLQAVVIYLGEKTHDGQLIESVAPAWLEIARLMKNHPSIIYQIDSRKWEEIIAGIYKKAGFDDVILTPRSGDLGRDVIAIKHGLWSVRFIDQVKAYSPGHLVPADDVRALVGVLLSDQKATKGIVTTTSDFAPKVFDDPSIKPHLPYRLELVNGVELVKRLDALANK